MVVRYCEWVYSGARLRLHRCSNELIRSTELLTANGQLASRQLRSWHDAWPAHSRGLRGGRPLVATWIRGSRHIAGSACDLDVRDSARLDASSRRVRPGPG